MQQQQEQPQESLAAQQVKKQGKKALRQVARKALKKATKVAAKVAVKAALATVKVIIGFLLTLGAPFILTVLAIIGLVLIFYMVSVLLFTHDDVPLNEDLQGDKMQLQAIADEYEVPLGLLVSAYQIHLTTGSDSEGIDDLSRKELKKIRKVAEKLAPQKETTTITLRTESYTETCRNGVCSDSATSTSKIEKTVTSSIQYWDRIDTYDYDIRFGNWEGRELSNRKTCDDAGNCTEVIRTSYSRTETYTEDVTSEQDYSLFDNGLKSSPLNYGENDIRTVEALYGLTGGEISYTDWTQGTSTTYGMAYHTGTVIPGSNIPTEYFELYRAAEKKFGVPWNYLAAIHWIETRFSTMEPMISYVGAEGHFQFMKCTWYGWRYKGCKGSNGDTKIAASDLYNIQTIAKYGGYGLDANGNGKASPWEIEDAMFTAAYYLADNGFETSPAGAIRHYNKSDSYVNEAMTLAAQFAKEAQYVDDATPNDLGFVRATTGRISSPFGNRVIQGHSEFHIGVDIANSQGTPIYAVADGVVRVMNNTCPKQGSYGSSCGGGWGNYIIITHNINGQVYETVSAHLSGISVKKGQTIKAGQLIGAMGTSGSSTGVHLHIELHKGTRQSGSAARNTALNPQLYIPM